MRPTWNEYYLGIANAASARGDCTRSKVGAVLVKRTPEGRHLTSLGYNGTNPGYPGCLSGACPRGRLSYDELPSDKTDYSNGAKRCIAFHAEDNALTNAEFEVSGAVVYVTREPCIPCRALLISSRIAAVVWPTGMEVFHAESIANLPPGWMHEQSGPA